MSELNSITKLQGQLKSVEESFNKIYTAVVEINTTLREATKIIENLTRYATAGSALNEAREFLEKVKK